MLAKATGPKNISLTECVNTFTLKAESPEEQNILARLNYLFLYDEEITSLINKRYEQLKETNKAENSPWGGASAYGFVIMPEGDYFQIGFVLKERWEKERCLDANDITLDMEVPPSLHLYECSGATYETPSWISRKVVIDKLTRKGYTYLGEWNGD